MQKGSISTKLVLLSKKWALLYKNGMSFENIAPLYKSTERTVRKYLTLLGVEKRFTTCESQYEKYVIRNKFGCWGWKGNKTKKGYGLFSGGGKNQLAHRYSYIKNKGEITSEIVRHTCDNPECSNPEHLILGSYSDNSMDALIRNTRKYKLTESKVKAILEMLSSGVSVSKIAKLNHVCRSSIYAVKDGTTWNHITRLPKKIRN